MTVTPIRHARLPRPQYLTPHEVAKALRVSAMTVYREIHLGRLAAVRIGRGLRIAESELDRYVAQQTVCGDES